MKCALEMMIAINTFKVFDAVNAEAEKLEKLNKLKERLAENKEKFFDLITKEMIEKRATSVSFEMQKNEGYDNCDIDGTILCISKKSYYANGRWGGYFCTHAVDGIWLEDITNDLNKLGYKVSTSTFKSARYYTSSKRNEYGTTDLVKLTISIEPNCIA